MKMDFENTQFTPGGRQLGAGRALSYPTELEQNIVQWVLEQRDLQIPMSVDNICSSYAHSVISPVLPDSRLVCAFHEAA